MRNANNCASTNEITITDSPMKICSTPSINIDKSPPPQEHKSEIDPEIKSDSFSGKGKLQRPKNNHEENILLRNHDNVICEIKCLATLTKSTSPLPVSKQDTRNKPKPKVAVTFCGSDVSSQNLNYYKNEYVNVSTLKVKEEKLIEQIKSPEVEEPTYINIQKKVQSSRNLPDDDKVCLEKESLIDVSVKLCENQNMSIHMEVGSNGSVDGSVYTIMTGKKDNKDMCDNLASNILSKSELNRRNSDLDVLVNLKEQENGDNVYVDMLPKKRLSIPNSFLYGAKVNSVHCKGDPGCFYEIYEYVYEVNPQAFTGNALPFNRKKVKGTACYCHEDTNLNEKKAKLEALRTKLGSQNLYFSCSKLEAPETFYENLPARKLSDNIKCNIVKDVDVSQKDQFTEDNMVLNLFNNNEDKSKVDNPLPDENDGSILQKKMNQIKQFFLDWS